MGDDLIPTVIALIALFLSSMQGRVATVLARGDSSDDRSFGAYMPMVILGGFLGVAITGLDPDAAAAQIRALLDRSMIIDPHGPKTSHMGVRH